MDTNEKITPTKNFPRIMKITGILSFAIFNPIIILIALAFFSFDYIRYTRVVFIAVFALLPSIGITISIIKKWVSCHKEAFSAFMIIILINIITLIIFLPYTQTDLSKYMTGHRYFDLKAVQYMPALEELPESQEISYMYHRRRVIIFTTESVLLEISYEEETYQSEKLRLLSDYDFLTEPVLYSYDYLIPMPSFRIGDYQFQVVNTGENYYPKSIFYIAYNDKKQSVVYMYFYDQDLDYICIAGDNLEEKMIEFVEQSIPYNWR